MDLGALKPGGAASAGLIKDGTSASFGKDVIEASRDALERTFPDHPSRRRSREAAE